MDYCSPWGHKESDMNEQPNWTDWEQGNKKIRKDETQGKYEQAYLLC